MKIILISLAVLIIGVGVGSYLFLRMPVFGSNIDPTFEERLKSSAHFDVEKGMFLNRKADVLNKMRQEAFSFQTILEWLKTGVDRKPRHALPQVKPNLEKFLEKSSYIKIIWMGHSTFMLNLSGKIILVDPVFSGSASPVSFMVKRFQPPVLSLGDLPPIDYIVISHDHYDHLDMESIRFFAGKDAQFLVPLGVGSHLRGWGITAEKITELDWWGKKAFDGVEFIATPAQHFSGRTPFTDCQTLWASWVIQTPQHKIYFSGDSGYDTHFKQIGDKYGPFDIAFIENGQYNEKWKAVHALPEEAAQAYFDLRAKRLLPVHWGMFVLAMHSWHEPVDRLLAQAKERDIQLVTPLIGEVTVLDEQYVNKTWWVEHK